MSDRKSEVLDVAARAVGSVPGVGDAQAYVLAYYRHVPDEDLATAGAARIAAVAREHAELAVQRPQGRAIVAVRAGGAVAGVLLAGGRLVLGVELGAHGGVSVFCACPC